MWGEPPMAQGITHVHMYGSNRQFLCLMFVRWGSPPPSPPPPPTHTGLGAHVCLHTTGLPWTMCPGMDVAWHGCALAWMWRGTCAGYKQSCLSTDVGYVGATMLYWNVDFNGAFCNGEEIACSLTCLPIIYDCVAGWHRPQQSASTHARPFRCAPALA